MAPQDQKWPCFPQTGKCSALNSKKFAKDPIAHILYLKNIHPEIYQRAHKFLEPIDYVGFRLTGRMSASFASITLHWMTDNRDISKVTYHDGLLKLAGLDRSKLPDLQAASSTLGPSKRTWRAPGDCART